VELLSKRESPERAVIRFQGKAFNALHSPSARTVATKCLKLGAAYPVLEKSLCCTFARLELIPRRIEIMLEARPDSPHAIKDLTWMSEVMRLADTNANQTTIVLGIVDPTKPPDEAWSAIATLIHHFAGAPEAEQLLRARLGLSPHRLHEYTMTARRAAIGYLSFLLHKNFRDGAPHDALVAELVWATISIRVDFTDIQHFRASYAERQST
jgi:hypothetical protein